MRNKKNWKVWWGASPLNLAALHQFFLTKTHLPLLNCQFRITSQTAVEQQQSVEGAWPVWCSTSQRISRRNEKSTIHVNISDAPSYRARLYEVALGHCGCAPLKMPRDPNTPATNRRGIVSDSFFQFGQPRTVFTKPVTRYQWQKLKNINYWEAFAQPVLRGAPVWPLPNVISVSPSKATGIILFGAPKTSSKCDIF